MSGSLASALVRTLVALSALSLAATSACGGDTPEYVQFANGFDFAVTAKVTDADGDTQTIEIPARGRVGADLEGSYTIELLTPDGTSMKKKVYEFAGSDERKERCQEYVNVLGSAAIVEEDLKFGVGIKGGGTMMSGHDHVKVCPRWGFETTKPPERITVKKGTVGMNLTWLHYIGDGDWYAAVESLLAKEPERGDQSRIRAWNIAVAVSKYDPKNARLPSLGPKFLEACHEMKELFPSGPLHGKGRKDCLANTKALFPDA